MKNYYLIFTYFFLFLLYSCAIRSPSSVGQVDSCLANRAAVDVGSGNTKMKVAIVDKCELKIIKIIEVYAEKIDFKEDLMKSSDKTLSQELQKKALKVFANLRAVARSLDVQENNIVGVATAALRDAKNGQEFVAQIHSQLGIRIKVISQHEEGVVGYYAAQSELGNQKNIVVWDIGGGSSQITYRLKNGFHVYEGDLASVNFKNRLISEIQKKDGVSPNPLSLEDAKQGVKLVKNHLREKPDQEVVKKIKKNHGIVFGIGGVHGESIRKQLNQNDYTIKDLDKGLKNRVGLSDEEIGGKYAATDVTNLSLVKGYMQYFGIKKVKIVEVNNSNGILLMPEFWPQD
ncbi:MAG: Ppx/GppA phosphatase family protein [Bacteriovoracaceae bacterium]